PKQWRVSEDAAEGLQPLGSGSRLATFPPRGPSPTQTAGGAPSGIPRARQQTRTAGLRPALLTRRGRRPHATAARTAAPVQSADTLHWAGLRPRPATAPSNAAPAGRRSAPAGRHHRAHDPFLAPEIGNDALLGAPLLAYVLDQVDVGVGANACRGRTCP